MAKFVVACSVVFVLAVAVVVMTQTQDIASLFEAFRAEPPTEKLAWFLIVLIPIALVPSALWLCDALIRQRKAAAALELRLGGVRERAQSLALTQVDADAAVHHLARTDPEQAIGAVSQRLTEAERVLQVQQGRNEIGDLSARVDALRVQQQALRERLVPVLEKRRSIEQLFAELDSREQDIDRTLAEIASGDDAVAIDVRLNEMANFVRQGHQRCDDIEQAAKTLASVGEDYADLRQRLEPYAAADGGISDRIKQLSGARDRLAADIEALQQTPQGGLAGCVQSFVDNKAQLDVALVTLDRHFAALATLRGDIDRLGASFSRVLDQLALPGETAGDAASRVAALSAFAQATRGKLGEIERTRGELDDLRGQMAALQSRLGPLEAKDGGIADVAAQVQETCGRLIGKIERLEAGEGGDLAARVKTLTETKQELEQRIATVTGHFSQLAAIRNDIAGLFDKLSRAADTASN